MNLPDLTYHDIPRILITIFSVAGLVYLYRTAIEYKKIIAVIFYFPLFFWLLHEVLFYVVYFLSNRFTGLPWNVISLWPQLLRFHAVVTIIGGIKVYRTGMRKWVINSMKSS